LLDTHLVLWWLAGSRRLGSKARRLIERNDCAASVATLIESRLLAKAGKLRIPDVSVIAEHLQDDGIQVLALDAAHVAEGVRFEASHSDVFDRLLLGAAAASGRVLLTRDAGLLALAQSAGLGWILEG
jgi:PIN domain nuclease of toxin-antitoxin system